MAPSFFPRPVLRSFFVASMLALWATLSSSQPAGFVKINVRDCVQLELPQDWTIRSSAERQLVEELARSMVPNEPMPVTELAASWPSTPAAIARVSFDVLLSPVTQAEFTAQVERDRELALSNLQEWWVANSATLWSGLAKAGIREVGHAQVSIEEIGGKMAYVVHYGRTSANDSSKTMNVALYHVPMGSQRVNITLSYIEGNQTAQEAIARVRSSIAIE